MKLYSLSELLDERYGVIGTPERDAFEQEVRDAVESSKMAERLKEAREQMNLTQEQLGEQAGISKREVSRIERGKTATLFSLKRVSQVLGVTLW